MQIPWLKRSDLQAVREPSGWILKDPVSLTYTQLDEVEYATLNLLDGRTTLNRILTRLQNQFPHCQLIAEDIADFIGVLAGHQLIRRSEYGDAQRLSQPRPLAMKYLQQASSVFRIRLPLFNPSPWVDRLLPLLRSCLGPAFTFICGSILLAAAMVVVLRFRELADTMPSLGQFLGPANLPLLLTMFVAVKLFHESGHAIAARWFGVECRECGIMLLFLTPVLYTDVTDGWMKPRQERMIITAAGIGVELVIAAVCVLLWLGAQPGLLKSILLNTAVLCSVNTLLFNGNPLLKFDGYFLLSDVWRIPNLSSRSAEAVRDQAIGWLTGQPAAHFDSPNDRRRLLFYGWCSAVYRVFLVVALLHVIQQVSESWNLAFLGTILAGVFLVTSVLLPVAMFARNLTASIAEDEGAGRRVSAKAIRSAILLALLLVGLLVPIRTTTVVPAFVEPDMVPVYVRLPGRVQPEVAYGDSVTKGMALAELHNPELQQKAFRLHARAEELDIRRNALLANPQTATAEVIPSLTEALKAANERLEAFEKEQNLLKITAPAVGQFLPPPVVPPERRTDMPQLWHGRPLDLANKQAWLKEGTLLGYVGHPEEVSIVACVDEQTIERIRPDQQVSIAIGAERNFKGTVVSASAVPMNELPSTLMVAGKISGRPTSTGVIPNSPTFAVSIRLEETPLEPVAPLFAVGEARISLSPTSLADRAIRFLRDNF